MFFCFAFIQPLKTLKLPQRTLHFIAGNIKLQLLELPKVGGKTNSPIRLFLLWLPPIITSLCYVSLCCSQLILPLPKTKPTVPFPSWRAALMNKTRYRCTASGAVRLHCWGVVRYYSPSQVQSYELPKSRHADFPQMNSSGWDERTRTCGGKNPIKPCSQPNTKRVISNISPKSNLIPARGFAVGQHT